MQDVHPQNKRHPMTTRTLRRPEWVALLAATLVATLIATMFAFTPTAHATDGSQLEETQIAAVEGDNENSPTRPADEAIEAVDEGLLLRGPAPIPLPESTPDPEAHNNEAPGTETNPAVPEQHGETEPLDEANQLEGAAQPKETAPLEGTETSDHPNTAQSNHGEEASNPDTDLSVVTPMSGQESVTLSLFHGPGQQPGFILRADGDCGTVPSTGYRTLSLAGALLPAETVWAEWGSWDGPFVVYVPTVGVAPDSDGRYTVTLTCNYGASPTPTQTATATYQTHPASISGTIRWTDGTGIQGVTVRVFDETTDAHVRDLLLPTTASGSYGPSWFPPGSYRLQYLSADGEELAVRNQVLFVDSTAVIDIDVPLPDWTASVRGTLTWQTGEPYVNADIALTGTDCLGDPVHLQVQSNSDGEFLFPEVQKGEYTVWGEPVIVTDPIEYVVNIVHDAPHPGKITGTATFSNGSFATGYVVLTYPNGYTRSATLSYGAFVFDNVSPGTYQLSLSSDYPAPNGPEPFSSGDIEVEVSSNQTTVQDIELVMPTATIQGLVGSSVDGSPLPGFSVSIWTQGLSDTTDAGGNFTLEPIEGAGSLLIEVHNPDGLLLTSFPVIMPQVGGYDFIPIYIDPTILPGEIKGTVTATDGSPIVGATIRVRITEITGAVDVATTTTEADGSYSITDLEPNWYLVDLIIGGKQVATRSLHVSNGQSVVVNFTDVDLPTAPDTGDVDGTVTWDDGTPVDGEAVLLVPVSGGTTLDTTTNADGTYEFTDVEVGDYLVQVIIDGDVAAEQTATVDADQTTTVDLVAPLSSGTPDPGSLHGDARWSDLSGPVDGVAIEIIRGATTLSDTTGPSGAYAFDGIEAGFWNLTATYDGDVILTAPINIPEGDVVWLTIDVPLQLDAPETSTVDGTVTWEGGTPVADETVRLVAVGGGSSLDTTTNADGTYQFTDVEVGDYLVQVIIDGDVAAEQTATVEADQTTTVNLVVATANDSDTGSTPDDETEEPTKSDPDMSDHDALPQTGLNSDTSALLLVAPLLLMLGLLMMWTARRNGVRQDLPK